MRQDDLQAKGDALLAALRAQRMSSNDIEDALIDAGFRQEEAAQLLDGFPLSPRPEPPPALEQVIHRAACEILEQRQGDAGAAIDATTLNPDRSTSSFWEPLLGGAIEAGWLLGDPAVAAAIESDDAMRLSHLMRGRRARAPTLASRAFLDEVLANPRLFAMPDASNPPSWRISGIGFRLMMETPRAAQLGTSIGTAFFCVGYVPIFPIVQFVATPASSREWHVLGRIPLAPFCVWWRRVLLVVAVALMAWLAFAVLRRPGAFRGPARGLAGSTRVPSAGDIARSVPLAGTFRKSGVPHGCEHQLVVQVAHPALRVGWACVERFAPGGKQT